MDALKITLTPQTAFGTPLVGDTLFGHLCWGIAEAYGADRLQALLADYCDANPFLIASDAFPAGHLPLPTLPSDYWTAGDETDRKKLKKKQWLPLEALTAPVRDWQKHAKSNDNIAAHLISSHSQAHNRINRAIGSTGDARFAPFTSEQNWYAPNSQWQLYLLHDAARISRDELERVLKNLGHSGYGRDASTGLGKYHVDALEESELFQREGNAAMTLAPCCPQGQSFDRAHSYYQTLTRFGRHGNVQATAGNPFKKPVLMAQSGAVFSGERHGRPWIGQGISGISTTLPATVHQGYAPAIVLNLELERLKKADAFS
ncbi:type III-A CRISPR-associated RAMP protein Csm4 [Cardiobacterium hominis]|uniref:type III-A CRISPR-associated RAMP protein Csm4 n=1 Tax=Cardiobacterium hominis TaxID=2718 RepID=UPI0028E26EF3|nr:hypothetical protein [Cardiobacterium hominis]